MLRCTLILLARLIYISPSDTQPVKPFWQNKTYQTRGETQNRSTLYVQSILMIELSCVLLKKNYVGVMININLMPDEVKAHTSFSQD